MEIAVSSEPSLGNERGHVATDMHERREAGYATISEFLVADGDDATDRWWSLTLGISEAGTHVEAEAIHKLDQQRAHPAAMPTLASEVLDNLGIQFQEQLCFN